MKALFHYVSKEPRPCFIVAVHEADQQADLADKPGGEPFALCVPLADAPMPGHATRLPDGPEPVPPKKKSK